MTPEQWEPEIRRGDPVNDEGPRLAGEGPSGADEASDLSADSSTLVAFRSRKPLIPFTISGVKYSKAVGKVFTLVGDKLNKSQPSRPEFGRAIHRSFHSWRDYVSYRQAADYTTLFVTGLYDASVPDGAVVTYKDSVLGAMVSASKDHLEFRPGVPSILRIDCDFKREDEVAALWPTHIPRYTHPQQLIDVLLNVVPELRGVAMLAFDSSSSMIYAGDQLLKGPGGLRVEVPVEDSGSIPDLLDIIHTRLWIAGHGWAFVGKAGQFLERSLVDLALKKQAQPDYAAPQLNGEGLRQARRWVVVEGQSLAGLPALTLAQIEAYGAAVQQAKAALVGVREKVERQVREGHTKKLIARGVAPDKAAHAARRRFDQRTLADDDVLYTESGASMPVAELLAGGAQFDRAKFLDPLEPEYDGGRAVAMFFWRDGSPGLHSFAHGGAWFNFEAEGRAFADPEADTPVALRGAKLIEGVPPAFPRRPAWYAEAVEALSRHQADVLLDAVMGDLTPVIEAGAAGLGKTTRLVKAIAELGLVANIFVPSARLAEEVAKHAGRCTIIRGRSQTYDVFGTAVPLCHKADVVTELAGKGVTHVSQLLCAKLDAGEVVEKCAHLFHCGYSRQFRDTAPIRIYTHAHLALDEGWFESFERRSPHLTVVDEDPLQSLVEQHHWPLADVKAQGGILAEVAALVAQGKPIVAGLLELYDDPGEVVREVLEAPGGAWVPLGPGTPTEQALSAAKGMGKVDTFAPLAEALLRALDGDHEVVNNIWLGTDAERRENVHVALVKRPVRLMREAGKVVLLDATPNAEAWRAVFHMWGVPAPVLTEIHAERRAVVVQCYDTPLSKRRLANDKVVDDLVGFVDGLASRFGSVGVCGPKGELVEVLRQALPARVAEGQVVVANFGGLRGLNSLKDTAVGVIVGRNLPPAFAVEAEARAIWPYEVMALPGQYRDAPAGYRMRDGRQVGVMVQSHPDPRVRSVLRQKRESETEQAIDRHRLIHREVPKLILLLSSLPVDVDVDELADFRALVGYPGLSAMVRAFAGVLPLAAGWLAEFQPATFPKGANAAKKWACRTQRDTFPKGKSLCFKGTLSQKEKGPFLSVSKGHFPKIYIGKVSLSPFALVEYREAERQGGRRTKAVTTSTSLSYVRAMLALHHDLDEAQIRDLRWAGGATASTLLCEGLAVSPFHDERNAIAGLQVAQAQARGAHAQSAQVLLSAT